MKIIDLQGARTTQRRPALDMGLIRFGDISMSCVLRNVSQGGAALDIGSQVGIPDQFTLIMLPQKKRATSSGGRNVAWGFNLPAPTKTPQREPAPSPLSVRTHPDAGLRANW